MKVSVQRLFVNYWDTVCNSGTPWRKSVQIWCDHKPTNCLWQLL